MEPVQGTGKTLVARKLAHYSGLDYAVMSGGDVAVSPSASFRPRSLV